MNPLLAMQAMTLGRVLNAPELAPLNIVDERKGLTDADFSQSLSANAMRPGGKKGAAIIVGLPWFDVNEPNSPGPALMMTQQFRCIEKPGINNSPLGTNISVEEQAIILTQLMHQFRIAIPAITFVVKRGDQLTYQGGEREVVIEVQGKHNLPQKFKTPAPVIKGTLAAGIQFLTAQGSVVYYTTDGSYPCASNPAATLYGDTTLLTQDGTELDAQDGTPLQAQASASITASAGQLLQAVATLPNQQASDLAGFIVS